MAFNGPPGGPSIYAPAPVTCVILDKSETMGSDRVAGSDERYGFNMLDLALRGVRVAHGVCDDHDFSLVIYSSVAAIVPVNSIGGLSPGGCANMSAAFQLAYEQMPNDPTVQSTIILLSDGRIEEDTSDPLDATKQLNKQKPHVRVHAVSIGYDANHTLMRDIADACGGVFRFACDVSSLDDTMCLTMSNVLRGDGPGRMSDNDARESVLFDMFCLCLRTNEHDTNPAWMERLIDDLQAVGTDARSVVDAMVADLRDHALPGLRLRWGRPYIMMLESSVRNRQRSNHTDESGMLFADSRVGEVETLINSMPPMKPMHQRAQAVRVGDSSYSIGDRVKYTPSQLGLSGTVNDGTITSSSRMFGEWYYRLTGSTVWYPERVLSTLTTEL